MKVIHKRHVTALKNYDCDECERMIHKGSAYYYVIGVADHKCVIHRFHEYCLEYWETGTVPPPIYWNPPLQQLKKKDI